NRPLVIPALLTSVVHHVGAVALDQITLYGVDQVWDSFQGVNGSHRLPVGVLKRFSNRFPVLGPKVVAHEWRAQTAGAFPPEPRPSRRRLEYRHVGRISADHLLADPVHLGLILSRDLGVVAR